MNQRKISGLLRLFRFELPFAAGVCVIVGELLALGRFPSFKEIAIGFLSVFFISAAALILNDYFDIESDKINAPERPFPAGLVGKQDVVILFIVVTMLGFICCTMISRESLLVGIFLWIIGFLYNWRFKHTGFLGNLFVSFSVGMTIIFGGLVVGNLFNKIVWLFGLMLFLIDLGEEIAADAMDLEGDRLAGSRSLAVIFGREKALKISAVVFSLVIVTSSLPFLLGWLAWFLFIPFLLIDAVILFAIKKMLDPRTVNQRVYIRWIYLSGTAALIIFLVIQMVG